ncbi:ROK family protein [Companilactobacillus sp. HBUAS59699]|uniref:ROK family protein n=1 Tax=Companilactobacillus sp. HBUAS59699 TaxID=3109358 RepID=UPI002FF2BD14
MSRYIGVDLGGKSIKYAGIDESGNISNRSELSATGDKEEVLVNLQNALFDLDEKAGIFEGVGVSVSGIVQHNGLLTTAGIVKPLYDVNLKDILEEKTELPVYIENNANAVALAEKWLGVAKHYHNYVGLLLDVGAGGAIIINDQIYHGAHARAGEFGWMLTDEDDIDTEMGSLNYRGAPVLGLLRRYNQFTDYGADSPEMILSRAIGGEPLANRVLNSYCHSLAKEIINLNVAFDPEAVVVTGNITKNNKFMDKLNQEVLRIQKSRSSIASMSIPNLVAAELDCGDAKMLGAVYQLIQEIK